MSEYTGVERRAGARCDQHDERCEEIAEIRNQQSADAASARTWRMAGSIAGGVLMLIMTFIGWLCSDLLNNLREDVKSVKDVVQTSSVNDARYILMLQHLEQRILVIEDEHRRQK